MFDGRTPSCSGQDSNTPGSDEGSTAVDDRRGQRTRDEGRQANFVISPTRGRDDRHWAGLSGSKGRRKG